MPRTFASTLSQPPNPLCSASSATPDTLARFILPPIGEKEFPVPCSRNPGAPEHRKTRLGRHGDGSDVQNPQRLPALGHGTPHLTQGGEKEFLVAGTPSAFLLVSDLPTSQCPLRFLCDLLLTVRSLRRGRVCLLSGMPSFILIALKQESEEPPPSATNNGSGQTAAL